MESNRKIFSGLLAVSCLLLALGCERSDVVTGVGSDVVSDMDSSLTSTDRGFIRVDLTHNAVINSFSLPTAPSDTFSTRFSSGHIYIGISNSGDTLAAHMQFQVTALAPDTSRYMVGDSLVGARLYFHTDDTIGASESDVNIFLSNQIPIPYPVNRSDKLCITVFVDDSGNECVPVECDNDSDNGDDNDECVPKTCNTEIRCNEIASVRLSDGNAVNIDSSTMLPNDVAKRIFDKRVDTVTTTMNDTLGIAFSILDYHGKMRKIFNPYVVLTVKRDRRDGDTTTVRDTMYSFTRVTAFENIDSAIVNAKRPYSSFHTQRTAVFEIDISNILDSLKDRPQCELLNAVVSFDYKWRDKDITNGPHGYRIIALDNKITDAISLFHQFGSSNSNAFSGQLGDTYNVFSIKPALRDAIKNKRDYIYVYLRATSEHDTILWDKSEIKVETVFTPLRSLQ